MAFFKRILRRLHITMWGALPDLAEEILFEQLKETQAKLGSKSKKMNARKLGFHKISFVFIIETQN